MNKNRTHGTVALLLAVSIAAIFSATLPDSSFAAEDKLKQAGRAVFEKYADSVLFVSFTVEVDMQIGGQGHQGMEQSLESLATVIREDGLMVLPNSSIDIAEQIRSQIRQRAPAGFEFDVTTSIKSLKIILPDGSEVPGRVLLQDADLDIAFVMPEPPEEGAEARVWTAVALTADAPRLKPLDDIFVLGRMERNVNRAANIRAARIESAIRRPRLIYRASVGGLGVPAFGLDGQVVGLFLRQTTGPGAGQFIIRPPKDVLKVAEQLDQADEKPADE